jgi:two-component system, cell cycle sensor histidine kinase and response regulator CckA
MNEAPADRGLDSPHAACDRAGSVKGGDPPRYPWIRPAQVGVLEREAGPSACLPDFTCHEQTLEAFQQSEERFRTSFEDAAVGMAIVSPAGQILHSNLSLQQMLGYDAAELRQKRCIDLIHPQDNGCDAELYLELLEGRRRTYQIEQRYVRKDGEVVWGRLGVSLVRDASGQAQFAIGILSDITDRKRAEEALQVSQEHLRQAQKMEAVGQLAGGVAHDFRNQLTVIKGYGEMLLRRGLVDNAAREFVEEILKAANRSATLTGQLLSFGRQQILRPEVVNLNHLLDEMVKPLRSLLGEDVDLSVSAAADLWRVRIDPGQFQQALVNLVVNARDAMAGGGTLSIETANVTLGEAFLQRHDVAVAGPYVMVAVRDSGRGMDEATLGRIFDPFFTTRALGQGTGLGLAMVYGFARQSGGCVDVISRPGQGTTFRLYFMRCQGRGCQAFGLSPAEVPPGGHDTVLVVEDEEPIRRLIAQTLGESGYQVLQAADARQALALASCHDGSIDLLLTDVVMPGGCGPDLARQLQACRPALRVLYVSGYPGRVLSERGIDGNQADLLVKPFDSKALLARIRHALDGQEVP